MRGTQLRPRHLIGAAALSSSLLLAGLTFASLPAGAQSTPASMTPTTTMMTSSSCPVLSVGNPNPDDNLVPGNYIISGEAYDPAAPAGTSGISKVDLFLGLRDQGGNILGTAVPGVGTSNPRFFSLEVKIPSGMNAGTTFAAYAQSSMTSQETVEWFPVFVGTKPKVTGVATPTPMPNDQPMFSSTCPPASAAPAAASAPAAAPSMSAPSVSMTPSANTSTTSSSTASGNACPLLTIANPGPGATLQAGKSFIAGSATGAGGVQRVDLFLGERDQGGTFLASGTPDPNNGGLFNVEVNVTNLQKGVDFAAYAIGNNGQQTWITFPIYVGSTSPVPVGAATPTPIPNVETTSSTCGH